MLRVAPLTAGGCPLDWHAVTAGSPAPVCPIPPPCLQPEFTASVLMEAHTRGLTTCIDTTGAGRGPPQARIPSLLTPGAAPTCPWRSPPNHAACPLPPPAGQGMKHSHWDKVLPHLDYALFCIKSPIPGGCQPATPAPHQAASAAPFHPPCPRLSSPWLRPAPPPQPPPPPAPCREVRMDHQAQDWAGAGVCG